MSFCPFVNEQCKGNQCMLWSNESCLVVSYLKESVFDNETIDFDAEPIFEERKTSIVSPWFKLASEQEIVEAYFDFMEKEFPETDRPSYGMFDLFLKTKGMENTWNLPTELALKIQKTKTTIEIEQRKRRDAIRTQLIEVETRELPSLIDNCIDWAKSQGFTRLTKADIESYLLEKQIEITKETQRKLYSLTNTKLKSKR